MSRVIRGKRRLKVSIKGQVIAIVGVYCHLPADTETINPKATTAALEVPR